MCGVETWLGCHAAHSGAAWLVTSPFASPLPAQVALEVEAARRAAEAQARVEVEALQQRLRWVRLWGRRLRNIITCCMGKAWAARSACRLCWPPQCAVCARQRVLPLLPCCLRAMEEYVEEADSKRLASASRVSELEAALAVTKRGEEDTYGQVRCAAAKLLGVRRLCVLHQETSLPLQPRGGPWSHPHMLLSHIVCADPGSGGARRGAVS